MNMTDSETFILSHPSQFQLVNKITEHNKRIVFKDIIKWRRFENNYPNIFIENVKELIGRNVIFVCNLSDPSSMFEQLSVLNALPKYLVGSLTILLPFFPCGTMEKIQHEGQIATAKTVANLLSIMPMTKYGPAQIVIYDIHALQERFYFGDSIIPRLETAVSLLFPEIDRLKSERPVQKVCIVFPDDGARKRFTYHFSLTTMLQSGNKAKVVDEIVICSKVRLRGGKYEVNIVGHLPELCHAIIVDDLINTGGTVLECAKQCILYGATDVSVFVTHAVFPQESWRRFLEPLSIVNENADPTTTAKNFHFSNFWITDSIPHEHDIFAGNNNAGVFRLLSIGKHVASLF